MLRPKVLLRADSNDVIGMGHRTRVETIARFLAFSGYEYRIISRYHPSSRSDPNDLIPTIWLEQIENDCSTNKELQALDAVDTIQALKMNNFEPDIVILDSYIYGYIWQSCLKDAGIYVVTIDDFRDRHHNADLVVELVPPPCANDRLCGLQYFPIATEFAANKKFIPPLGLKLLVTFGGGNVEHFIKIGLAAVEEIVARDRRMISSIDLICGGDIESMKSMLLTLCKYVKVVIHQKLPTISSLMKDCDVVICSGGNTMLESIVAHRPAIVVITADNQVVLANYLNRNNLIYLTSKNLTTLKLEIAEGIIHFPQKFNTGMFEMPDNVVLDTLGPQRLVKSIIAHWSAHKDHVA